MTAPARRFGRPALLAAFLLVVSWALPAPAAGQGGEWPTLAGMGAQYLSPSGAYQVSLSGQLDLETIYTSSAWGSLVSLEGGTDVLFSTAEDCAACHEDAVLDNSGGALGAHRLRLFTDVFAGDHVYALLQLQSDRGSSPTDGKVRARVEQAFVRIANRRGTWGVQAGRFASPVGAYPLRHLSVVDPFVRPPIAYDYRTLMNRTVVPADAAALLSWKETGGEFRRPGAPPIWDVPYQWGGMAFGRVAGVDLRVAAMNSAPSSAPDAWAFDLERLENPSWTVAGRAKPTIDLDLGFSWTRGPWMEPFTTEIQLAPAGPFPHFRDFDQEVLTLDAGFARGSTMIRAEVVLDRWEVPNVRERATEVVYGLEAQRDLTAGVFAAARVGHIDFRPIRSADGYGASGVDWDFDVTRLEAALGYRISRNSGLLLSAFEQAQRQASDADARLMGLRLWWGF